MGNRAVITNKDKKVGIYLHWNGGYDSVHSFLEYCRRAGYRGLTSDPTYGFARLAQVISNFMGADGLSVGVGAYDSLDTDNSDNGVYVVDEWDIIERLHYSGPEQNVFELESMIAEIEKAQPYPLPAKS